MAEYIEKQDIYDAIDLLMTRFPYKVPGRPDTYHPYNEAWADACSYALDLIRHHPPADVRPVRRGRWVRINKYDKESNVKCPSCNEEFSYIDGVCYLVFGHELPLFCPKCGADMKEAEDDG